MGWTIRQAGALRPGPLHAGKRRGERIKALEGEAVEIDSVKGIAPSPFALPVAKAARRGEGQFPYRVWTAFRDLPFEQLQPEQIIPAN